MRAILQRTLKASVTVDDLKTAEITGGMLVLLGIEDGDTVEDIDWLCGKITRMRIFGDDEGKMNQSILDTGGGMIVVSQFTLHASTKKGNRPSFLRAAHPSISEPLYETFCSRIEATLGKSIGRGVFGAEMKVSLINDGPVTIVIDSRARE